MKKYNISFSTVIVSVINIIIIISIFWYKAIVVNQINNSKNYIDDIQKYIQFINIFLFTIIFLLITTSIIFIFNYLRDKKNEKFNPKLYLLKNIIISIIPFLLPFVL